MFSFCQGHRATNSVPSSSILSNIYALFWSFVRATQLILSWCTRKASLLQAVDAGLNFSFFFFSPRLDKIFCQTFNKHNTLNFGASFLDDCVLFPTLGWFWHRVSSIAVFSWAKCFWWSRLRLKRKYADITWQGNGRTKWHHQRLSKGDHELRGYRSMWSQKLHMQVMIR